MNSFYLKKRRTQLGLSAKDIADKLDQSEDYTRSTLSRYESGNRYMPLDTAVRLAEKALDIPVKWLVSVPTLADNRSLIWYLAELFTPDLSRPEVYIGKDADTLSFSPEVSEAITSWAKLKSNLAAGLVDRFQYETGLYNLVLSVDKFAEPTASKSNSWNQDICRRVRNIINRDGCFDPEIPARLAASGYSIPDFWQDSALPGNPAGIGKLADALHVPAQYLTDQFFFDTDQDLIAFLVHIELSGDPANLKLVPEITPSDVKVRVKDPYLKATLKRIKDAREMLANGQIDHIEYLNMLHQIWYNL